MIFAAVLALSPAARTAVANWLGLRGLRIGVVEPGQTLPVPPTSSPTSAPPEPGSATTLGATLRLGERVSLEAARGRVRFPVLTPSSPELVAPDEVYVMEPPSGGQVSLVYGPRPGLPAVAETGISVLFTEFGGQIAEGGYFQKVLPRDSKLETVTVNGGPGYWIEGPFHTFFYKDSTGKIRDETIRLVGNTLLWEQGGLTLRIESALSKDAALAIAQTVR
jgi:hypothetical protein